MRISRIGAAAALAIAITGVTAAPAFADDPVPADPPPVVDPPPVEPPAPVAPPVVPPVEAPPAPPVHVETADELSLRTTGYTVAGYQAYLAEQQAGRDALSAQLQAHRDTYGAALLGYYAAHPGMTTISYDLETGIYYDADGNVIDMAAYGSGAAVEGLAEDSTIAELEAIVAEPILFLEPTVADYAPSDAPAAPTAPASVATDDSDSGATAVIASAGWVSVAALAFWRRRYRALELLKKARAAADV